MHYGASTRLHPDMVMSKAVSYFGSLGLKVTERSPTALAMGCERGEATMTLTPGTETEVEIETRGFDAEVKAFLQRIG